MSALARVKSMTYVNLEKNLKEGEGDEISRTVCFKEKSVCGCEREREKKKLIL